MPPLSPSSHANSFALGFANNNFKNFFGGVCNCDKGEVRPGVGRPFGARRISPTKGIGPVTFEINARHSQGTRAQLENK